MCRSDRPVHLVSDSAKWYQVSEVGAAIGECTSDVKLDGKYRNVVGDRRTDGDMANDVLTVRLETPAVPITPGWKRVACGLRTRASTSRSARRSEGRTGRDVRLGAITHHNAPTPSIGAHPVKHWTTYPLVTHPYNPEFMTGEGLARFARAAEAAGFDGIALTTTRCRRTSG